MTSISDSLGSVQSLRHVLPEAILSAAVLLVLAWDLIARGRARMIGVTTIALAALSGSGALAIRALVQGDVTRSLFGGQLVVDRYALAFRLFFAIVTFVTLLCALPTEEARTGRREDAGAELVALLLTVTVGLDLMASARSFLLVYLGIEIVSVLSFILAGYKPHERKSSEASLKYVVFGGVASGVMLYGMSWIYGLTRTLDMPDMAERILTLTREQGHLPNAAVIGTACVVAGFAYKISAVPFHMWAPDVYEGAPTVVTAFLSVGPKAAGFAVLARFFHEALRAHEATVTSPSTPWPVVAGLLAVATMTVGNLSALGQTNVKRMLAFSSIAHAGTMLLAFSVFTDDGIAALLFYIVAYCTMNLGAFLVVLAVAERNGGDESLTGFRALGTRAPLVAAAMAVFLFSLVGLPPFGGFVGKVYVFAALLRAGGDYAAWYWLLAACGVVNTVVSLFYYARVLRAMYLEPAVPGVDGTIVIRRFYGVIAAGLVLPTIALGVYWEPVYAFVSTATFAAP